MRKVIKSKLYVRNPFSDKYAWAEYPTEESYGKQLPDRYVGLDFFKEPDNCYRFTITINGKSSFYYTDFEGNRLDNGENFKDFYLELIKEHGKQNVTQQFEKSFYEC